MSVAVIAEVLRFEETLGRRRAIVRWTGGAEGVALTWFADEILICEGDLIGKTAEQVAALHGHRDREYLRS